MGLAVSGRPRGSRLGPVLVQETDPRALLEAVLRAQECGRAVVVLDAGWPQPLRNAARELLAASNLQPGGDDLVVFTSGSGGRPRAVHRSWESWRASVEPLARLLELADGDVTWLPGHPAATAPLYAAWHASALGLAVRFAGEPHADATVVHAPPTLVPRVLGAHAAGQLPRLRLVVTAGDRVPASLARRCAAPGLRLVAYYGAAELSFVAVRDDDRPGYRAFPGVDLDVRDGLLWSRSRYQAHGYLDTPEGTAALRRAPGGWASVGDAARWVPPSDGIDAGGRRVEILGRADQAITVSGHTVLAEDVEHALAGLPGVAGVECQISSGPLSAASDETVPRGSGTDDEQPSTAAELDDHVVPAGAPGGCPARGQSDDFRRTAGVWQDGLLAWPLHGPYRRGSAAARAAAHATGGPMTSQQHLIRR